MLFHMDTLASRLIPDPPNAPVCAVLGPSSGAVRCHVDHSHQQLVVVNNENDASRAEQLTLNHTCCGITRSSLFNASTKPPSTQVTVRNHRKHTWPTNNQSVSPIKHTKSNGSSQECSTRARQPQPQALRFNNSNSRNNNASSSATTSQSCRRVNLAPNLQSKLVCNSKVNSHELLSCHNSKSVCACCSESIPKVICSDCITHTHSKTSSKNRHSKRKSHKNGESKHNSKHNKSSLLDNGDQDQEDNHNSNKKSRRTRRRKRQHSEGPCPGDRVQPQEPHLMRTSSMNKRMKWTECNSSEVSRLHRNCVQNGQPLAPYNTTQFIMNEHITEKDFDFDELSGQIERMHNNRRNVEVSTSSSDPDVLLNCDPDSSVPIENAFLSKSDEPSTSKDDYYSSPSDESYFLEQQFHEAYDNMHAERLSTLPKNDLVREYLNLEKELELLKSNSSERDGASITSLDRKRIKANSRHKHRLHKQNKDLRRLLKNLYNNYNRLLYCMKYVQDSNAPQLSDQPPASNLNELQLTKDLHYQIEKYLISDASASDTNASSNSITNSSDSDSFSSTSTSLSSEDNDDDSVRFCCSPDLNRSLDNVVANLVNSLVNRVVQEGN